MAKEKKVPAKYESPIKYYAIVSRDKQTNDVNGYLTNVNINIHKDNKDLEIGSINVCKHIDLNPNIHIFRCECDDDYKKLVEYIEVLNDWFPITNDFKLDIIKFPGNVIECENLNILTKMLKK